jgi:rsbT antagonist protein RsbS
LSVAILKLADTLIACVQDPMSDRDLSKFKEDLIDRIGVFHSSGVVIDLSAVDVFDSLAARTLRDIAESSRLRGAETVIVGIHAHVAVAMIRLGLKLDGITSAHDLEDGLDLLVRQSERDRRRDR